MEERTIKVYNFEELKEDIQNKVIEKFRYNNEYPFLNDELNELLIEKLKENNIQFNTTLKCYYSLSYSQGDGFCFIGDFVYNGWNINITHKSQYYHKKSVEIEIYKFDEEGSYIYPTVEEENQFKNIYYSICDTCEKAGYEHIENEDSEEYIKENIEANDYKFLSNGEIWN